MSEQINNGFNSDGPVRLYTGINSKMQEQLIGTGVEILYVSCFGDDKDICGSYTSTDGRSMCYVKEVEAGEGVGLIAAERQRQVSVEGWTPDHDQEHDGGELAKAAACYIRPQKSNVDLTVGALLGEKIVPDGWPFYPEWYKPSGDRIRDLVKAGALIAAEIDRLNKTQT